MDRPRARASVRWSATLVVLMLVTGANPSRSVAQTSEFARGGPFGQGTGTSQFMVQPAAESSEGDSQHVAVRPRLLSQISLQEGEFRKGFQERDVSVVRLHQVAPASPPVAEKQRLSGSATLLLVLVVVVAIGLLSVLRGT